METIFRSLVEFQEHFSSDEICREFLEQQRWNGIPVFPYFGSRKVYRIEKGKRLLCSEKTCQHKFSVTVGTIYESSKIPLQKWFLAMYIIGNHKKGISSLQLSRDLHITQKSAWFLNHRIREMLREKAPQKLKDVVEIDETYCGGKNKNRHADKKIPNSQGRSTKDKTPVLGSIQRGGKLRTVVVPNTQAETIKPIIQSWVKDGSIMVTDEWQAYRELSKDYLHVVVNHGQEEYVRGAFHTNTMEGFWSLFKRGIYGIYHQVSPKHLHRYCDEFSFRFNEGL